MKNKINEKFPKNKFETLAWNQSLHVCGIDEVGRGCLAGPVVTGAVILPINTKSKLLKDSKILNEQQRNVAYDWITKNCFYSVGILSSNQIDRLNIYQATLLTMKKSLLQLMQTVPLEKEKIKYILVDSMPLSLDDSSFYKDLEFYYFNKGENLSISVAAASIVAKVTRDRLMAKIAKIFPQFLLHDNKGYGTVEHIKILDKIGRSIIHRTTFVPKALESENNGAKQQTLF